MEPLFSLPQTIVKDGFPDWMFWSRIVQVVFDIVILGLDAFVISEWNKNDLSNLLSPKIETNVGGTTFTAFVMFTVRSPSICTDLFLISFSGYHHLDRGDIRHYCA
jgi:hypothetical protein